MPEIGVEITMSRDELRALVGEGWKGKAVIFELAQDWYLVTTNYLPPHTVRMWTIRLYPAKRGGGFWIVEYCAVFTEDEPFTDKILGEDNAREAAELLLNPDVLRNWLAVHKVEL